MEIPGEMTSSRLLLVEWTAFVFSIMGEVAANETAKLGEWEFIQCWVFLGLKAGEDEIKSICCTSFDTNNSGFV